MECVFLQQRTSQRIGFNKMFVGNSIEMNVFSGWPKGRLIVFADQHSEMVNLAQTIVRQLELSLW